MWGGGVSVRGGGCIRRGGEGGGCIIKGEDVGEEGGGVSEGGGGREGGVL